MSKGKRGTRGGQPAQAHRRWARPAPERTPMAERALPQPDREKGERRKAHAEPPNAITLAIGIASYGKHANGR